MMAFAYAPSKAAPPDLYARYTLVKGLGLTWEDVGGLDPEDVPLLTQLVNIQGEADRIKGSKPGKRGGGGVATIPGYGGS